MSSRALFLAAFLACAALAAQSAGLRAAAEDAPISPSPKPAEQPEAPPGKADEPKARARFQAAYQAADKPALRADTVFMLKGLQEIESKRLLASMLGDPVPTVKRNACKAMAETPDAEGYFVKPLSAALGDRNFMVRVLAAEALAGSRLKGLPVKSLVYALLEAVRDGEKQPPQDGEKQVALAPVYHQTLARLTGKDFGKSADYAKLSQEWLNWWRENRDRLEQEDEKYLEQLPPKAP